MKSRVLGRCVTFNGSYAFLRPIGGDGKVKDVFAHESSLPNGTISVGDKVTFDLAPDTYKPGRMRATNVTLVDGDRGPMKGRALGCTRSPTQIARWLPGSGNSSAISDATEPRPPRLCGAGLADR
jgi:cold shock CspA family protein